jgi:hypothetical protein
MDRMPLHPQAAANPLRRTTTAAHRARTLIPVSRKED